MNNALMAGLSGKKNMVAFILLWLLTLALYFPTVKAGWVIDAIGGIYNLRHLGFSDFINGSQSANQSLQQEGMIAPTLKTMQGKPIMVFVAKDLLFDSAIKSIKPSINIF